jgi:hypothetical protein
MSYPHKVYSLFGNSKEYQIELNCFECDKEETFVVPAEGYEKWRAGTFIQDAMPELSADQCEMLISGTCPDCWNKFFAPKGWDHV